MRFRIIAAVTAAALLSFGSTAAFAAAPTAAPAADELAAPHIVSMSSALATNCYIASVSTDGGAFACWNPTGEHLYNCDGAPDGHHPELYYYRSTSSNTQRHVSDSPGYGNCVDHNLADIPESGWVDVLACNYEGSRLLSCDTAYTRVSANG